MGNGEFGAVYKAQNRKLGVIVAIKKISKEKINKVPEYIKLMKNDLKKILEIDHINILKTLEILQDSKFYYIVSDFMNGGEVFDRIVK